MRPSGIYLFPSNQNRDKPVHESGVQRAFQKALKTLGWKKQVSVRTLRHCFATHLLEAGMNLKTIQELMGHNSLETTQIYLHISRSSIQNLSSPLDLLTDFYGTATGRGGRHFSIVRSRVSRETSWISDSTVPCNACD